MQKARRRVRYVVALTVVVAALLVIAGSAALGIEFYASKETLNPRIHLSSSSGAVNTVSFNNSQGKAIVEFNFIARQQVTNSTTFTALDFGPSIWHAQGTRLESLRLRFSLPNGSSNCGVTSAGGPNYYTDGYPPYQAQTYNNANGSMSLSIPDFGPQGAGTVNFGFGLNVPANCSLGNAASLLQMNIELVVHGSSSVFVGTDYLGHSTLTLP
jgi:hypothetical protein